MAAMMILLKPDVTSLLTEKLSEVALWCSLQTLTWFHQDSADEARRRELLKEAGRLMAGYHQGNSLARHLPNWLQQHLPKEQRWARALSLLTEADPDSLAPLDHQLRSSTLKPAESIASIYSEERRREIVDGVINLRSLLINSHLAEDPAIPPSRLPGRRLHYIPNDTFQMARRGMPPMDSLIQTIARLGIRGSNIQTER